MIELLLPSLLAGLALSLITGPLGAFVVWRKMSYFGDTLSHAALLGISFGFLLKISPFIAVIFIIIVIALSLVYLESQQKLAMDTLLGILAHSALSLGIVLISFIPGIRVDLMGYLFGDLLSITYDDMLVIAFGVLIVGIILMMRWNQFLFVTVSEELAFSNGINITKNKLLLTLILAITIGISMKFVGALIITSLMMIPAATARFYAKTPEKMAFLAVIFGMLSVILGIALSIFYDTPTGPSVVIMNALMFVVSILTTKIFGYKRSV